MAVSENPELSFPSRPQAESALQPLDSHSQGRRSTPSEHRAATPDTEASALELRNLGGRIALAATLDVASDERRQKLCVEAAVLGCDVVICDRRLRFSRKLLTKALFDWTPAASTIPRCFSFK